MMTHTTTDIPAMLRDNGIQPSVQRIAIMSYLIDNRVHPTADAIYNDLRRLHPTLSRTTIYNTLHLLVEHRLVNRLDIDPATARYDIAGHAHGHFICSSCGAVTDIKLPHVIDIPGPEGAVVTDTHLSLRGICPRCAATPSE